MGIMRQSASLDVNPITIYIYDFLFNCTKVGQASAQLIRFARASSHVGDFNTHNKLLTQKLLKQGYRYHKLA